MGRLRIAGLIGIAVIVAAHVLPAAAADAELIAAARKEGRVTWYTTQIVDQLVRPAAALFEKTYGIQVDYIRADSNDVTLRILNESQGGRVLADVFDGTSSVASLKPKNLVLRWTPDSAARLPPEVRDPEGYWVGSNLYVLTPGYNTDLVAPGTQPKTFGDLLDPKWKGRMVWNSGVASSAAAGFIGLVLKTMGEDQGRAYLRDLAKQDIAGVRVSARQVLNQVIAGEYAVGLAIFNNHAVISAEKGAPCTWIPMSPAMTVLSVLSVMKGAPHPNAAKLLVDFLVSEAGQKLYRDADYLPVDPAVPPRDPSLRPDGDKFRALFFTPEQVVADMPHWMDIYNEYFR